MAPVSDREAPIAQRYAYEVAQYRPVEPERRIATLGTGGAQECGRGDVGAFEQREKESADPKAGE